MKFFPVASDSKAVGGLSYFVGSSFPILCPAPVFNPISIVRRERRENLGGIHPSFQQFDAKRQTLGLRHSRNLGSS